MPTVLIAECKQEVSSFNPVPSRYEDFRVSFGEELFAYHAGVRNEVGGALAVLASSPEVQAVPLYGARAITSGGTLARPDWERLSTEFLDSVRSAPAADACYFSLHGAMSADGEPDPEGFLLEQTRVILGERLPIVVSLDLHGILTDRMLRHADAVVVYHTYPHVDFWETGQRAGRLLMEILSGRARPVTAVVPVPALVRGDELITETGRIRHVIAAAKELESAAPGLSAGMFWGNPFTDVPELRSNSLCVTNDDENAAVRGALRLAELFWEHHEAMQAPLMSLPEGAEAACRVSGTAVLVDAADAPSSGASGDSFAVVEALLSGGYEGRVLAPVVDPTAVRAALSAGIGGRVRTTLGGALDPDRFRAVPFSGSVRHLSDGSLRGETFGERWNAGPTAVLESADGRVTAVVTSRPVSLYDRALFLSHGQDPRHFDAVVVKSPHCQHWMYAAWAGAMLPVDAPGATSANLPRLGHRHCARPIFPLDEGVSFCPAPRVYRRGGGGG